MVLREKLKCEKGYTIFEVLVVLGIILIVSFLAISMSIPQLKSSETGAVVNDLESAVFLYQQHAYSGKQGKAYGVKFNTGSYTLFIGDSFATAELSEVNDLPAGVSISSINLSGGADELAFAPGVLVPSSNGTVRFTDGSNAYIFEISAEGSISSRKE